jgi:hypothetical protein
MVDQFQFAADRRRGGRAAVQRSIDRLLGTRRVSWFTKRPDFVAGKKPKDWVKADFATEEPPLAGWNKFSTAQYRALQDKASKLAAGE